MKILACGDFHLGAGADYGPRPGDRLLDQAQVLDRIVALAREEDVAAVLFAGDAFERRYPTPAELMVWREFVTALRDIPFHSISGNHDVANASLPTGIEVLADYGCHRYPEVCHIGDGMGLATLPWTPPAHLVASQNGGDRDAIHERAAELLLESARGLRAMVDGPCILLAHWSVSGASLPNGLPVDQLREPVLDVNALLALGFDFIVLGHIHETQVLASNVVADFRSANGTEAMGTGSVAFYVGSPMVLNFGEAKGHHGVVLLDTEARSLRHVEIPDRPFVTVSADLTLERHTELGLDATDCLAAAIATHLPLTDAVVRLRYKATAEQARRIDLGAIRQLVADAGASKLFAVQPDIVRSDRARVEGVDESLDEREAVRIWLDRAEVARSQREPFEELFIRYLDEVRG